jgi:acid phosphatase class B
MTEGEIDYKMNARFWEIIEKFLDEFTMLKGSEGSV